MPPVPCSLATTAYAANTSNWLRIPGRLAVYVSGCMLRSHMGRKATRLTEGRGQGLDQFIALGSLHLLVPQGLNVGEHLGGKAQHLDIPH